MRSLFANLVLALGLWCATVEARQKCKPGYELDSFRKTCGQCPSGWKGEHYCGWTFFGFFCWDDCYNCWTCKRSPTPQPTSRPTPNPSARPTPEPTTPKPTTAEPTSAPTFQPTSAPTLGAKVLNETLSALEECVDGNLLFDEMIVKWGEEAFQKSAGDTLLKSRADFGLSEAMVAPCLAKGKLIPPANYSLEDLKTPDYDENSACFAFAIYHYLKAEYLPSLGVATPKELAEMDWRKVADLCPATALGFWEYIGPGSVEIDLDGTYRVPALTQVLGSRNASRALRVKVGEVHQRAAERVEAFDFADTEHTLADLVPEYQPAFMESLVSMLGLPPGFYKWLESHQDELGGGDRRRALQGGSEADEALDSSFSPHTSVTLLQGLAGSLIVNDTLACAKACSPGQELFVWRMRTSLADGRQYASSRVAGTCQCREAAIQGVPRCPPSSANPVQPLRCTKGTFYDSVVDMFFSTTPASDDGEEAPAEGSNPDRHNASPLAGTASADSPMSPVGVAALVVLSLLAAGLLAFYGRNAVAKHDVSGDSRLGNKKRSSELIFLQRGSALLRGESRVTADANGIAADSRVGDVVVLDENSVAIS